MILNKQNIGRHDELLRLLLVHRPNLADACVVRLFKSLVLGLQFLEVVGEGLVLFGQLDVGLLVRLLFFVEPFLDRIDQRKGLAPLLAERFSRGLVHLLTLFEDGVVELQLLIVEFENGLHVFHALL